MPAKKKQDDGLTVVQRAVLKEYCKLAAEGCIEGEDPEEPFMEPDRIIAGIPDEMLLTTPLGARLYLTSLAESQVSMSIWLIWASTQQHQGWKLVAMESCPRPPSLLEHMYCTRRLNAELMVIQMASADVAMRAFEKRLEVYEDAQEREEAIADFESEGSDEGVVQ